MKDRERPFFSIYLAALYRCSDNLSIKGDLALHKAGQGHDCYTCDVCMKTFGQAWTLENHMKTHSVDKPFLCDHCDGTFSKAGNLKRHKENVHKMTFEPTNVY